MASSPKLAWVTINDTPQTSFSGRSKSEFSFKAHHLSTEKPKALMGLKPRNEHEQNTRDFYSTCAPSALRAGTASMKLAQTTPTPSSPLIPISVHVPSKIHIMYCTIEPIHAHIRPIEQYVTSHGWRNAYGMFCRVYSGKPLGMQLFDLKVSSVYCVQNKHIYLQCV